MQLATFSLICALLLPHIDLLATEVDSVRTIVTPVQCFGLRNGAIRVDSVFGGEKPFFYSIDGNAFTTNPFFDRLRAGEYTLHVRDASGAVKGFPFSIKEPTELRVRLQVNDLRTVAGKPFDIRASLNIEPEFLQQMEWRPPPLFPQQNGLEHSVSISETTEFAIIVRDHNGCPASDNLKVEVDQTKLYFPNVIKPGSAEDAYFTVFAGEGVQKVASLQIYSRAGALVFERHDFQPNAPLLGWGGRWDGKTAQVGVYPWLAVIEMLDGKQVRYEGTVTVVN